MTSKRVAAKPVAKSGKDNKNVNVDNDPLADLGLTTSAPETAPKEAAAKAKTETKKSAVVKEPETVTETAQTDGREEVEVGELEFGFIDFIPTTKRRTDGSKYKFDQLAAPQQKDGKTLYAHFTVKLLEGVDADKLRRSVQSATTQANKQGKNEGKYFVSRSVNDKAGKFAGMQVIRTDQRPD